MTEKTLNRAIELKKEIEELEELLSEIEFKKNIIVDREKEKCIRKNIPIPKSFLFKFV